VVKNYLTFTR